MKAVSGVVLSALAVVLTGGIVHAEPLSGTFTGAVRFSSLPSIVGDAATGTFSINPLGCALGSASSPNGFGGCDSSGGVTVSITVAGTTQTLPPTGGATTADSFIGLGLDGSSLSAQIVNALAPPVSESRNFAYVSFNGAPGAFGSGQDYTSLQPGAVTGGTAYFTGGVFFENIALSSVTFDQAVAAVPEVSSVALLAGGLSIMLAITRRRTQI